MKRPALSATLAVLLLATGCSTQARTQPSPKQTSTTAASTPTLASSTPAKTPDKARGVDASPLPAWAGTAQAQLAARFTIAAATPDARLDTTPINAWRRTTDYTTPALTSQIQHQRDGGAGSWWNQTMRPDDGWVSITITNILGDEPQAPGTNAQSPTTDVQVLFTRTYHTNSGTTRDTELHTWTITIDRHQVTDFTPDAN